MEKFERVYIGIDPGKRGAVASIYVNPLRIEYVPMPGIYTDLLKVLYDLSVVETKKLYCYIEQVQYRPNQKGVITGITNYGRLLGYLEAFTIPYTVLSAQKWKKYYGLLGKDKEASVNLANQRLGLSLTKTQDGIAEALLLASYGIEKDLQ